MGMTENRPTRRRWFRFSVRTMLVTVNGRYHQLSGAASPLEPEIKVPCAFFESLPFASNAVIPFSRNNFGDCVFRLAYFTRDYLAYFGSHQQFIFCFAFFTSPVIRDAIFSRTRTRIRVRISSTILSPQHEWLLTSRANNALIHRRCGR
jgi:hypothetical protein